MNNLLLKNIDYNNEILLKKILDWRNNEVTRKFSVNKNIINDDIFKIIITKYKESYIQPLIIYYNDIEIGIYTFVKHEQKIFIGLNISPEYRGIGIGKKSLELLLNILKKNYKNLCIYAQIDKLNKNSLSLFSKFFNYHSEDNNFFIYKFEF